MLWGGPSVSSASHLVLSLLFNRVAARRPRPVPLVVLLGPRGSGKSDALTSISRDCGSGVVHARAEFATAQVETTVQVLAQLANDFSIRWRNRSTARFTRFTLSWIAVQTPLDGLTRDQARERLRTSIREITGSQRSARLAASVASLADSAKSANVLTAPVAETVKQLLPPLIQSLGQRPWANASRWIANQPASEGAQALDVLVDLGRRARTDPAGVTAALMEAFLADVRDNHARMAGPDVDSPCFCQDLGGVRHWHNWVLLLDDIDHPVGAQFVADLLAARERHLRRYPGDYDPLLVIATSGRWDPAWEPVWRPLWKSASGASARARTVPSCRTARYEHWAPIEFDPPASPYFPVLLEPLSHEDIVAALGGASPSTSQFVQRATGGLPAAVKLMADLVRGPELQPSARDLLATSGLPYSDTDPWGERLGNVDLARHLPSISVEEFITAAPFATAPWLVPDEATSRIPQPDVARILTELRTALWVSAPEKEGDEVTPRYARLHPWIARTLLIALAHRDDQHGRRPSYRAQFEVLLDDPDTLDDDARRAYCQLALGQIDRVASSFELTFDRESPRAWCRRLELVTSAPDDMPPKRTCRELYAELIDTVLSQTQSSTPAGNTIRRLIAARWLAANPFAVPDQHQNRIIAAAYRALADLTHRSDISLFLDAAEAAERGEL